MSLTDAQIAANEAARDNAKQVVALTSVLVAAGIALQASHPSITHPLAMVVAAVVLLSALLSALLVLDATMRERQDDEPDHRVRRLHRISLITLVIGLGFAVGALLPLKP